MFEAYGKLFSPSLIHLIAILFLFGVLVGCRDDSMVTEYPLLKVNPKKSYGHEWLTLNPTTYRIGDDSVTSETAGILTKHEKCVILSPDNWECQYSDGSGRFGFRDGTFWAEPTTANIKYVSRFKYNCVRCEWAFQDKYEGKFWGSIRCITGWQ